MHIADTIKNFEPNKELLDQLLNKNAILATALAPKVGYEKASEIVYKARKEARTILDVAVELTTMSEKELSKVLDPKKLT